MLGSDHGNTHVTAFSTFSSRAMTGTWVGTRARADVTPLGVVLLAAVPPTTKPLTAACILGALAVWEGSLQIWKAPFSPLHLPSCLELMSPSWKRVHEQSLCFHLRKYLQTWALLVLGLDSGSARQVLLGGESG